MPTVVKELMMKELDCAFEANPYAFISRFNGLSVADMSEFRRALEKVSRRSLVVKHSLAKKIFAGRRLSEAEKFLTGSILVTFGVNDPQNISKAIMEFAKTHEKLVPAGMIFEKQVYDLAFVKQLAKLPSRHELLTRVAVGIKAPISGLVLTLGQVIRGLAVVLNEVRKKKEAAAPAAA